MKQDDFLEKQESNIAIQVFSVSSAMIGVCFTVIGILNFITSKKTLADEITAVDAIIFLLTCIISYRAMKIKDAKRRILLEKRVDYLFILGLSLMVFICIFIVLDYL